MGLTKRATGCNVLDETLQLKSDDNHRVIALAGNPNVGKSTVFNELTGLNQHTGNWPGKTVSNASGSYTFQNKKYTLVDLPGIYSLMSSSPEEEIARDFICFENPDTTVVVVDATSLERNLNLVLQILEATPNVIVCVNLLDEAKKKQIDINLKALEEKLGVPVVGTSARQKEGLDQLIETIANTTPKKTQQSRSIRYNNNIEEAITILEPMIDTIKPKTLNSRFISLKLLDKDTTLYHSLIQYLDLDETTSYQLKETIQKAQDHLKSTRTTDVIVATIVLESEKIYKECVTLNNENYTKRDEKIDKLLTSKKIGIPLMILLLAVVFWITITGANYPSQLLSNFFFQMEEYLTELCNYLHVPDFIHGALVEGVFRTLGWVISVMLPPMAIFFPLFTLLEDSGYLPRIAFNLDRFFKKACAHGKQALTMCMGFGCNACGVIGCRIIESPRERLIAILTNNFVPCNGRFPTLISIITMFFIGSALSPISQSILSTILLTGVIVLGVFLTLMISKLLSKTILKGLPSSFVLELPPYRKPQVGKVIVRSILDRTLFVLGRAIAVAAPAGLVIWLLSNITISGTSLLAYCTNFLDPFANLFGLDGVILMAFILGFPANEIVFPIIIMSYLATGHIIEMDNLNSLHSLLVNNGWTWVTAICTMLFSLIHFPCGTTCLTIKKETGSIKWTLASILIPTLTGLCICFIVANVCNFFV